MEVGESCHCRKEGDWKLSNVVSKVIDIPSATFDTTFDGREQGGQYSLDQPALL
jgi:hypothetical protein